MIEDVITFGDIEFEKHKFHRYKCPLLLEDVDIDNVLVSNKISFGEKTINTLLFTFMMIVKLSHYINLPEMCVYVKRYDGETKCMHFLIVDDDLLEKLIEILFGIKSVLILKRNFDSKLVYNKKQL